MKIVFATLHVRPSAQAVPLAAGCLAAALPEKFQRTSTLVNLFPGEDREHWAQLILAESPTLVAFPLYCWNRSEILSLARHLRQLRPEITLVCGGPEATPSAPETLREGGFDGVILGEGESVFASLVETLARGETPATQQGLLWNDNAAVLPGNAAIPLADLPSPWLSGVLPLCSSEGVLWETSRGCIYGCAYCFDARGTQGVRHVPEERLALELDLFAAQNISQVWVLDSTFNSPPERGKGLLRLLSRHAPGLHYHLEARAEHLDAETVELLCQLKCSLQLGLQSINPGPLKVLHRHFHIDAFEHACRLLNQAGVTFGIDLIYGLPQDSHAGFVRTLDFALLQRPNQLDIFPLAILPGTELHERREELGILAMPKPPYTVEMLPDYTPRELRQSRELAEACNLFYNRGRAVGFFSSLVEICERPGSELLSSFRSWLSETGELSNRSLEDAGHWTLEEVLDLQIGFSRHILESLDKAHFTLALEDLIRFHFHYAECLLGDDTPPNEDPLPEDSINREFRTSSSLRLIDFNYEIQDLLDMEADGLDLVAFIDLFTPVGSTALFIKRNEEIACESLSDDFTSMLKGMCGEKGGVPKNIDLPENELIELMTLAWGEGLIEDVTAEAKGP